MNRKTWLSAIVASTLACSSLACLPTATAHAEGHDLGRMSDYIKLGLEDNSGNIVKNQWLVQVQGAPISEGGSATSIANEQQAVLQRASAQGIRLAKRHSYSEAFNGLSVTLDAKQVMAVAQLPGVTGIYPVVQVARPDEPATAKPDMASAVNLSGVGIARDELGYTGKGIKVGVIDSGIDIDHPDLGGRGVNKSTPFPTKRVRYGYDFVGDDYDAAVPSKSIPTPDAIPDDCGGHGTHVAGIIGADGNPAKGGIRGVAPQVTFGAYRVFGCTGSTSSDVILAAIDRAGADHMDVVNMSLGFDLMTWPDYPTAQATDALAKRGVVMVTAAGNSGDKGVFSSGAPSVGHRTISVASYENTQITTNAFLVGGRKVGYGSADGAPMAPKSGDLTLVAAGAPGTPQALACTDFPAQFPAGSAVLIQRGTCSFRQKALAAQKAGAAAVVLYNNVDGTLTPTVEGDPAVTIPVVMISKADGEALVAQAGAKLTWSDATVSNPSTTGGQVSSFSSWGVGADLTLKPDLGAPGGNIWSDYPLEKGGHTSMSGTSMATPHVAGAVALLLQARPALKGHPEEVQRLLQNTAIHTAPWSLNPKLGLPEPVIRQGAGLIQVDRAILTQQSASPSKISLGDDQSRSHTTTLTLHNEARRAVVYSLANQTSIGTLGTSDPSFDQLDAKVSMPQRVVVPARGTAKVRVTITSPAGAPNGYLYGGWLVASAPTGATLTVPYLGMAGDYQRVSVLTAPGSKAPCLGKLDKSDPKAVVASCLDEQSGHSYSMIGDDTPVAVFRVEYPVEKLQVQVYQAKADGSRGALLGTALELDKDGRELGDVGYAWDGTYLTTGKKPYLARASAGSFVFEVRALHALGKASVAADWESWTSPSFTARFDKAAPNPADVSVLDGTLTPANR